MTHLAEEQGADLQELQKQFDEVAIGGFGAVKKDELVAVLDKAISLGERLLEIYKARDQAVAFSDVAYHLIYPYERRAHCYAHQHNMKNSEYPLDLDRAIEDYSRVVHLVKLCGIAPKPEKRISKLLALRAECYLAAGDHINALRDAEAVVQANPSHESYLLRGRCRLAAGHRREAGEDAKMAAQLGASAGYARAGWIAATLYRDCHPELAKEHDQNLEELLAAYERGERDFRGIDLSWTYLGRPDGSGLELRDCILDHANLSYCSLRYVDFSGSSLRHACLDYTYAITLRSEAGVTFSGADLTLAALPGTVFSSPEFQDAILRYADFEGAYYSSPGFEEVDLTGANLKGVRFSYAQLGGFDLAGLNMEDSVLVGAVLRDACLWQANLKGCDLRQSNLSGADMRRANLKGADLFEAEAPQALFTWADLTNAHCPQADLSGADLRFTTLTQAHLFSANLEGSNLSEADVDGADLSDANLHDADFTRANLSNSHIWGAAVNDNTNFSDAKMPEEKRVGFLAKLLSYIRG